MFDHHAFGCARTIRPLWDVATVYVAQQRHRRNESHNALVLTYHSISSSGGDPAIGPYCVSAHTLNAHLRMLRRMRFTILSKESFEQALKDGKFPKRSVLITFDDGYTNFVSTARPLLAKYQAPSALFIVTDEVGKSNTWDEPAGISQLSLAAWVDLCALDLNDPPLAIESHLASHTSAQLLTSQQLMQELTRSSDALVAHGFSRPASFAYPYGHLPNNGAEEVANSAYQFAYTTAPESVRFPIDSMHIPRLTVRSEMSAAGLFGRMSWLTLRGRYPWLRLRTNLRVARANRTE